MELFGVKEALADYINGSISVSISSRPGLIV